MSDPYERRGRIEGQRPSGPIGRSGWDVGHEPGRRPESPGRTAFRPRVPTVKQLAELMVGGILRLPRNYRRGMYLDIFV